MFVIPPAVSKRIGARHKRTNCPRQTAHTNFRGWQAGGPSLILGFASLNCKPAQPVCRVATELFETNHWQPLYVTQSPDNTGSWFNETAAVCLTRLPTSATKDIDENLGCPQLARAFFAFPSRILSMKSNFLHAAYIPVIMYSFYSLYLNPCFDKGVEKYRRFGL
jgi:hypothetical protein